MGKSALEKQFYFTDSATKALAKGGHPSPECNSSLAIRPPVPPISPTLKGHTYNPALVAYQRGHRVSISHLSSVPMAAQSSFLDTGLLFDIHAGNS